MNDHRKMRLKILALVGLAWLQRTVRVLVISAWLFGAGYALGWAIMETGPGAPAGWEWVINPQSLPVVLGGLLALPFWLGVLLPFRLKNLLWKMDRRLGLAEQVSAAWETAGKRKQPEPSPVVRALYADTSQALKSQALRILLRGWRIGREFVALAAVVLLVYAVFLVQQANQLNYALPAPPEISERNSLPTPQPEPQAGELMPNGLPALAGLATPSPEPNSGEQTTTDENTSPDAPLDEETQAEILEALAELGSQLNQSNTNPALPESNTLAEAGKALETGDISQAAENFQELADQAGGFSEQTRQTLSEALKNAGEQIEKAGDSNLGQAMQQAADKLDPSQPPNETSESAQADSLDQLSQALSSFEGKMSEASMVQGETAEGGGSAGGQDSGQISTTPGEFERLEGQGETFQLQQNQASSASSLLNPDQNALEGLEVSVPLLNSGVGGAAAGSASASTTPLVPVSVSWKWRSVIAQYFSTDFANPRP